MNWMTQRRSACLANPGPLGLATQHRWNQIVKGTHRDGADGGDKRLLVASWIGQ